MPVIKEEYGYTAAKQLVEQFTLVNKNGMKVKLISFGASLVELWVPNKEGKAADVVLGWPGLKGYETDKAFYFASVIGRVANRIKNGRFTLDGINYQLVINNGPNHIHGGTNAFHNRVWDASIEGDASVKFSCVSADGEEGYPGEVTTSATYQLTDDNKLILSYVATTTKRSPVNLTNHSYFNLAGHDHGTVIDHEIYINADNYTPFDETSVPIGEIAPVAGTIVDLRKPIRIGDRIYDVPGLGFDNNFCVKSSLEEPCARVTDPASGRCMEIFTTKPGVQFYTANYLNDTAKGKEGVTYTKHGALCLETQFHPNTVNQPNFPSCILQPGETYNHTTIYKFSW